LPLIAGIVALLVLIGGVAWWFLNANRPVAAASKAPAEAAHLSIVVLPFTNLSNDPAQDYFADGITENLTTDLSRIRDSFVIARNTAFTFKGKSIDAKEIGRELGVRYVLEGSVQRDGTRVRVNAQLIDAQSGAHLWADRFEEDASDLFKLQDQVVARLANSLATNSSRPKRKRAAGRKTPTPSISSCAAGRCCRGIRPRGNTTTRRELCSSGRSRSTPTMPQRWRPTLVPIRSICIRMDRSEDRLRR
jgi:TolB-like protein